MNATAPPGWHGRPPTNGGSTANWPQGGGGRVAVVLTNSTDFGNIQFESLTGAGNMKGAGGTVYLQHAGQGPGQGRLIVDWGNRVSAEAAIDAVIGEHRSRRGIDKQARREGDDEIAVRHAPIEERVGLGGFLIHVGIESIAGEVREVRDVFQRDLALFSDDLIADLEQALAVMGR